MVHHPQFPQSHQDEDDDDDADEPHQQQPPNNQPELEYALHVGLEATNECVINFH